MVGNKQMQFIIGLDKEGAAAVASSELISSESPVECWSGDPNALVVRKIC